MQISAALYSLLAILQPLSQDYPATSVEWSQASDAIAGGASTEDAIMPAPLPNREALAEFRSIWESVSATQWNVGVSYDLLIEGDIQDGDMLVGTLSDGTVFQLTVIESLNIYEPEILDGLPQDELDDVAVYGAAGFVLMGILETDIGSVEIDSIYITYTVDDVQIQVFFPIRRIQVSAVQIGLQGAPTCCCGCAQCAPALAACMAQANLNFRQCRRTSGAVLGAGLLSIPFTGGWTGMAGAIGAFANQAVCVMNYEDDRRACLNLHAPGWWEENGYVHWNSVR